MRWRSRTSSTTPRAAPTATPAPAGTASSSRGRTWRTARRWPPAPAARSSCASSTTRNSSCVMKSLQNLWQTRNWLSADERIMNCCCFRMRNCGNDNFGKRRGAPPGSSCCCEK